MSTTGIDDLTFGPYGLINIGPMYQKMERFFAEQPVDFHVVKGMGAGTIEEMADRSLDFLNKHPVWRSTQPVHVFGHSAGGLVSRLLLSRGGIPPGKVLSYISAATPHRGTQLARTCIDMPKTHPSSYRAMRALGMDLKKWSSFYENFTAESLARVFASKSEASLAADRVASVVCVVPPSDWCKPLRWFHKLPAFKDFDRVTGNHSDGMIESTTQRFGEVIAEVPIDHFRQLGWFGEPARFERFCSVLSEFFATSARGK